MNTYFKGIADIFTEREGGGVREGERKRKRERSN